MLNLPSAAQVAAVNRLARTTGSNPVPPHKAAMGYRHEADKFGVAELTLVPSDLVKPSCIRECPVQLEAVLTTHHTVATRPDDPPRLLAIEVRIIRAHIEESILMPGEGNRIDPDKWHPLIMSFQQFYGLGARLQHSTLAEIPETAYRPAARMSA